MKRTARPRRYSFSDIRSAVYLAGGGATAEEIAEALGNGVTVQNVYALLSRHGIRLVPKARSQTSFVLVISREAYSVAERLASPSGADPRCVIGRLAEEMLRDRAACVALLKGKNPQ
jgi:hypothetical protein